MGVLPCLVDNSSTQPHQDADLPHRSPRCGPTRDPRPLWQRPSPCSWPHTPWLLSKPVPLQRPLQRWRKRCSLRLQAWFYWRRSEYLSKISSSSSSSKEPLHWGLWLQCALQGGEQCRRLCVSCRLHGQPSSSLSSPSLIRCQLVNITNQLSTCQSVKRSIYLNSIA